MLVTACVCFVFVFVLVHFYLFCCVFRLCLCLAMLCFPSTSIIFLFFLLRYVGIKIAFYLQFLCLFV